MTGGSATRSPLAALRPVAAHLIPKVHRMTASTVPDPYPVEGPSQVSPWAEIVRRRNGFGIALLLLAGLALLAPLTRADVPGRVGVLLVLAAVLEIAHGFRRATAAGQRAAWVGGGITLAMGGLLVGAPLFAMSALLVFLAGWFALDGLRCLVAAVRRRDRGRATRYWLLAGVGNLAVAGLLLAVRGPTLAWTVAVAAALRILGTASNVVLAPVLAAEDSGAAAVGNLDLADRPELETLARRITDEESARLAIDRGWIVGFVVTLFAIHLGRMGLDRSALGILSPVVAVLGDILFALLLAFAVVIPVSVTWRRLTRGAERRAWAWCLAVPAESRGWVRRVVGGGLAYRLRCSIRLVQARTSFRTALSRGLQIGLPLAAIIAATIPVWGMSWYFDTENWAAGIWDSWAEERTDTWREAMVRAVLEQQPEPDPARAFAVHPPGCGGDFAFLVIGDTGEGDASQLSLKAHFLDVVRREEVKFVVISSDVIYPTGAMRHYEANFWLPFMGTTKPVYAIPGNHDWYDALEAFVATFYEPTAARTALRARVAVDKGVTSTTDSRIEELIATASRFRSEYRVPTQFQKAPFFQFQTDTFALFAVDTGVAKRLDPAQLAWFKAALESATARGKTKMAILGHPLYAGGRYQAADNPEFAALHQLLRDHNVAVVMAGDTHDLEYYVEPGEGSQPQTLHFVNGGGGAYLSYGTALDWPAQPDTTEWAYYPGRSQVVAKIGATVPAWKKPFWWWTNRWGAWPFSAELLSAAFDANTAPFLQSFVEVRVEPSKGRVRLIPHGVHGPLKWGDFDASSGGVPTDAGVEWSVPLKPGK